MSAIVAASFAAYLLMMLAIGYVAWRSTSNLADYILGGRRLGPWSAALSAGASDMSGWLLMGLPGLAFVAPQEALWLALGLLTGTWLNWRLVAPRLRVDSLRLGNALTIPAYLAARFPAQAAVLRPLAAATILLFFLFYTASGFVAGGKLFETTFDLPYEVAVLCGVTAIVLYTFFGGFLAVSWTDVVQGLMMLLALLLVPVMLLFGDTGGAAAVAPGALWERLNTGESLGLLALLSSLSWGLGYFGQPHILARFKAIHSVGEIPRARRIAVSWSAATLGAACLIGAAGSLFFDGQLADSERVFMLLVEALFHPLVAGVLLAAILAAIMSTADSQLLVCSSVLAEDFYRASLRPAASGAELLLVGRLAVAAVAVSAAALALGGAESVLGLVAYAWAGFGAAFGPVLLLSLFWPRMHGLAAMAAMLAGAVVVVVWRQLGGGLFDLYEMIPGVLAASGVAVLLSLVLKPSTAPR